jgi:hypothetical protein
MCPAETRRPLEILCPSVCWWIPLPERTETCCPLLEGGPRRASRKPEARLLVVARMPAQRVADHCSGEKEMQMKLIRTTRARFSIVGELLAFLWRRKLWWMIPMVTVLVLFGLLLAFTQGSALAPFIYTLF